MIKAILFDLDDTLLGNHIDTFLPPYFKAIGRYAAPLMPADKFIPLLLACTQEAITNTDYSLTNHDIIYAALSRETGWDVAELEAFFAVFYETEFPKLHEFTQLRPCAPHLVRYCLDAGFKVVVATNPLFVRAAIEMRLAWAGVPVPDFEYDLVTTMENMHATKPNTAYYREILDIIHCPPEETIMIGDSWKNDMQPAASLKMKTFWVSPAEATAVDDSILYGSGTLEDFYHCALNGWLQTL